MKTSWKDFALTLLLWLSLWLGYRLFQERHAAGGIITLNSGWGEICSIRLGQDRPKPAVLYFVHGGRISNITWSCGDRHKYLVNQNLDRRN